MSEAGQTRIRLTERGERVLAGLVAAMILCHQWIIDTINGLL